MMYRFLPLIFIGALTACMSPEERAAQREMQIKEDIEICKGYGLKEGSEAFGNCRLQLDLARERRYREPYFYGGHHYGHGRYGSHIGVGTHF